MIEEQSRVSDFLRFLVSAADLKLTFTIEVQTSKGHEGPTASSRLSIVFDGPDKTRLTARGGELLLAMEHISAKMLRLESDEHDRITFEADGFKANREAALHLLVEEAMLQVARTGKPFGFAPMTSRERRMLHIALNHAGFETVSSGEGARRFVVLLPKQ